MSSSFFYAWVLTMAPTDRLWVSAPHVVQTYARISRKRPFKAELRMTAYRIPLPDFSPQYSNSVFHDLDLVASLERCRRSPRWSAEGCSHSANIWHSSSNKRSNVISLLVRSRSMVIAPSSPYFLCASETVFSPSRAFTGFRAFQIHLARSDDRRSFT